MIDLFVFTPNPFSLIQYAILAWVVSRQLLKTVKYKRAPGFFSWIDGLFIVAFFVVIGDAFWAGWCALRFVPMFPNDLDQILISFFRDITAIVFFYMVMERKAVYISRNVVIGLFVVGASQFVWFFLAPSPAYTDHTFAVRHGFPLVHVLAVYSISHFFMRLPLWFTILQAVKIEDNSISLKKQPGHNGDPGGDEIENKI